MTLTLAPIQKSYILPLHPDPGHNWERIQNKLDKFVPYAKLFGPFTSPV